MSKVLYIKNRFKGSGMFIVELLRVIYIMKRKLIRLFVLFGTIFLCLVSPQKIKANPEYSITNNDVTAKVNNDGSVWINREINYQFKHVDKAKGVFYQQNLDKNQKVEDLTIQVCIGKKKEKWLPSYRVIKLNDLGYLFRVYYMVKDGGSMQVVYHYKITNLITNYRDIAELNFMIVGNNWNVSLNNVKATVIFPGSVKNLQAWAHGPLNGHIDVNPKKGRIEMTVRKLNPKTGIEVHSIFPLSVTAKNKNVKNKNRRKQVLKKENYLATQANKQRLKNNILNGGLVLIALVSALYGIIRGSKVKKIGTSPKPIFDLEPLFKIPDVDPVTAQILDQERLPDEEAFTAYVMELATKKKIKVDSIDDIPDKKQNFFTITLVDPNVIDESEVMNVLFNKVGNGRSFTTEELRRYKKSDLSNAYLQWRREQERKLFDNGLVAQNYKNKRENNQFVIGLMMIISVATTVYLLYRIREFILPIALVDSLLLILDLDALLRTYLVSIYTEKGAELTNQVHRFKKALSETSDAKMHDNGDLTFWENAMPYAVAFGLAKNVFNQLKSEFSIEERDNNPYFARSSFGNSLSFVNDFSAGFSSSAGSSGAFSGGSSGGSGGGSGGGVF